jgi:hypothetical protein
MPNRFTKKERKIVYAFLVEREGEKCDICNRAPPKVALEVDHKEGTYPLSNSPENLRLLCKSCNRGDGNRQRKNRASQSSKSDSRVSVREGGRIRQIPSMLKDALDYQSGSVEMQANDLFERSFCHWLFSYIEENRSIEWQEAIYSGAQFVGCSSQSTDRYLKKMTSLEGPLLKTMDSSRKWVVEFRENRGES